MRLPVQRLNARIKLAWADTVLWNDYLADAYKLGMPGRNQFGGERTEGDQPGNEVFDSTLQSSVFRFVNRIQSQLFPSFMNWSRFLAGETITTIAPEAKIEVDARADAATSVCFSTIHTSNFAQSITEFLTDLAFGTGAMLVNKSTTPNGSLIDCISVNPAELAFDVGPNGVTWGIFRKHKMPPHLVEETWKGDFKPPPGWAQRVIDAQETATEVELDEACYYCPDHNIWYFDVIMSADKNGTSPVRVVERQFKRNPWIIGRWSHQSGESRGRGPVLEALASAKSLNKAQELLLISGSFNIAPMWTYLNDGVFNPGSFTIAPGEGVAVGSNGGPRGSSIQTLEIGGDLNLTQFIFEDLRMQIKKIMLDDQLPPEQGSVRSATEWTARQKELAQNIAAPFGRLFTEVVRPFMQRVLDIHVEAGILEPMEVDGHVIDLQVTSPLAQGENISDIDAAAQFVEIVGMLEQYKEGILPLTVKLEDLPSYFATKMGIPNNLMRTPEEIQAINQQQQQAQQDAIQQEQDNAMQLQEAGQQPQQGEQQ